VLAAIAHAVEQDWLLAAGNRRIAFASRMMAAGCASLDAAAIHRQGQRADKPARTVVRFVPHSGGG
jgi:hypothetical protein